MGMYEINYIKNLMNIKYFGAGNFVRVLGETSPKANEVALVLDSEIATSKGNKKTLSLTEINEYASKLSEWYLKHAVEEKDPVCLFFEDSVDYFLNYVALTNIGAIPVFANGNLNLDVLFQFINNVGARILICNSSKQEELTQKAKKYCKSLEISSIEKIDTSKLSGKIDYYSHSPNDPVLLGHTSGTTGIPKAVQFNHEGFFYGVKKQITKINFERILSALPHSHASAISITMSGLLRGSVIKVQTRKSPKDVLADIEIFAPDLFVSFPKTYVDFCRLDLDRYNLDSIKCWLSTGDANHESHIRKLISYGNITVNGVRCTGSIFVDNLGSSEMGFAAFRNVHKPNDKDFNRSIGKPFDWVDAKILGKDGKCLPPNEVGYLGVISKSVTAGYWNNSLMTEKNRLGRYWLTGDLAYKSDEDKFYHVDRVSDQIVTDSGIIYSCELEEKILSEFSEVFDCSVYAQKQQDGTLLPAINVELNAQGDSQNIQSRLNDYMKKIGFCHFASMSLIESELNVGITGKVLKRVMRESKAKN